MSYRNNNVPERIQRHCHRLLTNDFALVKLNLSHEQVLDQGGLALGKALSCNTFLKELILNDNILCREGSVAIFEGLASNTGLQILFWGGNMMGRYGAAALGRALKTNSTLKELWLVDEDMGDEQGVVALFADGLRYNMGIETFHLSGIDVENNGCWGALGQALEHNTCLTALDLGKNQLDDEGITAITHGLRHNTGLKRLDLRRNNISNMGAIALESMLCTNGALEYLNLYENQISDAGALAIALSLTMNRSLVKLDLTQNDIGDEGAIALGECLSSSSLQELNLTSNRIGNAGAVAIARGLEHYSSLKELFLLSNNIGAEGLHAIVKALQHNKTIRWLRVDNQRSTEDLGDLEREIDFYIRLNEAGRGFVGNVDIPTSLWPLILERATNQADVMFCFLAAKPDLMKNVGLDMR